MTQDCRRQPPNDAGFTIVELIVAMLILTVGIMAMAGSTGAVFTQLRVAGTRTARMSAVSYAVEDLSAQPFDSLGTRCQAFNQQVGQYTVTCTDTSLGSHLMQLELFSSGPAYVSGQGWQASVPDTFVVRISR